MEIIESYAIQYSKCLRYLGISEEKQQQVILCPDCAKEKQNSPDKTNLPEEEWR